MKCKFCGCTDDHPCIIAMTTGSTPFDQEYPLIALPSQATQFTLPCHWIAPNVCSAPQCVTRGYQERCALIETLLEEEDLVA